MPPGRLPGRVSHTSTTPTAALTFSSGAVDGPYTLVSTFLLPVRTSVYTLSSMRAHLRDADTAIAVHHPSPSFHVDGAYTLVSTFLLPVRTSVYTLSSMRAHLRDADTAIAVHHPSPSFHVDG